MYRSIVVAVDPSPARHRALRAAGDLARLTGAEVHVVHVAATTVAWDTVVTLEADREAEAIVEEALGALRAMGVGAHGEAVRAMDREIAGVISRTAAAAEADLIVLGPHHRGAVAAFISPRVSDAVAHAGRVSVLLVPEAGPGER
ncbi:universal stress protein [Streptomyces sp. NPDC047453]|uniref:universal stress protein n=1 Tax=Streptomyces sp. NPDC047453 TaxID=3154812 RepID=UPI0033C643A4